MQPPTLLDCGNDLIDGQGLSMKARWKVTLDGAKDEALLAVDLYNQPSRPRHLEGFFVHMHWRGSIFSKLATSAITWTISTGGRTADTCASRVSPRRGT